MHQSQELSMTTPTPSTHYAICPLCEATCGLAITIQERAVTGIRGDTGDVFSHGYLCPKAYALKELDADPDRLRAPLIRRGDEWHAATWDAAFAEIDRRLPALREQYGRDAVAAYLGNPNVHSLALQFYVPVLLRLLRTRNIYSASTLDQMPKQVSAGYMFGTMVSIPIPDVDRTDYLLILGANPLVSNGSLMTAPDMRGRLRALKARGGKFVVIDPRRTRTAEEAGEHHFIRPGTDALFLFALVHTICAENLARPGRLAEHLNGIDAVAALAQDFAPETVAATCGIRAATIRRLARELAGAEHAAVYGRLGTCTQEFGTLASWLVDVLNALTGNLDRAGGVMFPLAPAGQRNASGTPGRGKGIRLGQSASRVRGLPQVFGELPTATLTDEILTPGEGQVRALITIAGNPLLSAPHADRLAEAFAQLDFMVSVDSYLNETTRFAHVILPPPSPLESSHYDLAFTQLAVRNAARYSRAVFPRAPAQMDEWAILLRLTGIVAGQGPNADPDALDDLVALQAVEHEAQTPGSPLAGRDPQEVLAAVAPRRGPERLLDILLRAGPYGDGFGTRPGGLTLAALEAAPHGIDLGPLQPRIPEVLRTPSGKIELAPDPIVADVPRLRASLQSTRRDLVLIGRRELRSNNSWMHNLPALVKGPDPCTLLMHPTDAARLGLADGARARVTSAAGSVEAPVQVTEVIMPGVVSLPHGWGHAQPGTRMAVAASHAGANANRLVDDTQVEPLSGNAIQNGVPVTVAPAAN
jgi:anaerobic selenocysteine-containing dehydrogenase